MIKRLLMLFLLAVLFHGCTEIYEFKVKEGPKRGIVVEGFISDISAFDYQQVPDDGRYFTVKLKEASPVDNVRDSPISGASVAVVDDMGSTWQYAEGEPGVYYLIDPYFKALPDRKYKILIQAEGNTIESNFEELKPSPGLGDISFEETEKEIYEIVNGKEQRLNIKGVDVFTKLPKNESPDPVYYRWDFVSSWIYIAPDADWNSPVKTCWVTNPYYLNQYEVYKDLIGDYNYKLFFLKTTDNGHLSHDFTVLIRQFVMSKEFYTFWDELKKQQERGGLFDPPPYNIKSNLSSLKGKDEVYGYFGVVNEDIKRWYFNIKDLSYSLTLTVCPDTNVPKPPQCSDCMEYNSGGTPINVKPFWWR